MSELIEQLRNNFADEEYRNSYVESIMNSHVAAQIKTLREENDLTQEALAQKIGTKQAGISRLENVNYSGWKVETLRKLARAFRVRLKITFEEFGTLPEEIEGFRRDALVRRPFDKDPVFSPTPIIELGSADIPVKFPVRSEMGYISNQEVSVGAAAQGQDKDHRQDKRYATA